MSFLADTVANPLVPTGGEAVSMVIALLFLGFILVAIIAVLRSEHTIAAKAGMLLLCLLVPVLGAIVALFLARQEPDRFRSAYPQSQ